jgi:hypothetical protein
MEKSNQNRLGLKQQKEANYMAKVKDSFHKIMQISDPLDLEVDTDSGNIVVKQGEAGTLDILSHFEVRAWSEEEALKIAAKIKEAPPIQEKGNVVRIGRLDEYTHRWFWGPQVTMNFLITVPLETAVDLDSGSGDQKIKGVKGPVRADTGSGDIEIEEIETDINADTGSGNITLSRVGGDIEAETGSGNIIASHVKGNVNADTGSGNVRATQIGGHLSADTGSGNITAIQVGGNIDADTGSGNIDIESTINDGVKWVIETGSGNAHLKLPCDARFKLRADTGSGEIEIDGFELTITGRVEKDRVVGQVGKDPTAMIHIDTASGNIRIKAD